ncbi:MAG TPA: DNA primase noncatalytic subunit PriX [Conexivisphaerales archaeon]|nr:DNA primase noncatalytic subunit PriX [Conexivisphaerales archaeon]
MSSSVSREAEFVRYPFMPGVEGYLRDSGFSLDDIADPKTSSRAPDILARAEERMLEALERRPSEIRYEDRFVEILSFIVGMIMVKATMSTFLERAFSRSEGRRSMEAFKEEGVGAMCNIMNGLFDLRMETVEKLPWRASEEARMKLQLRVPAERYLEVIAGLQLLDNPKLALVNNTIYLGYVYLAKDRLVEIVQDQFSVFIFQRFKRMEKPVRLPPPMMEIVDRITPRLPKPKPFADSGQYNYIEKILERPIMDGRHRILWLILPPYLINVKKLPDDEAYDIIMKYMQKCGWHETNAERLIRYNINRAKRIGLKPPRLERLAETNPGLYRTILEAISRTGKA